MGHARDAAVEQIEYRRDHDGICRPIEIAVDRVNDREESEEHVHRGQQIRQNVNMHADAARGPRVGGSCVMFFVLGVRHLNSSENRKQTGEQHSAQNRKDQVII
jgi:hypothetical protein